MNRRMIIVAVGVVLVLQFVGVLFYSYLVEIGVLSRPSVDPVMAFFLSWIALCVGVVIIWIGIEGR
jgi:hypothetical protein